MRKWVKDQGFLKDSLSFLCVIRTHFDDQDCPEFVEIKMMETRKHNQKICEPCFGVNFDVAVFAFGDPNYNYVMNDDANTRYPGLKGNESCGGKKYQKGVAHHYIIMC